MCLEISVAGATELLSYHSEFCQKERTSGFSECARQPIIQLDRTASVFECHSLAEWTSVTPTEISNQPRRPGSRMSARSNVTRSSSDSQTYPPFAVQVDSETKKDRDQFYWSRSFAFGSMPVEGAMSGNFKFQISNFVCPCISERREPKIDRLCLPRFVGCRCLQ